MSKWEEAQKEELKSWLLTTEKGRKEKIFRETIRYPRLLREMGLDRIDTSEMKILDIGGGPIGILDILPGKEKYSIDPLNSEYEKYYRPPKGTERVYGIAESMNMFGDNAFDLVVCTNAIDHVQDPKEMIEEIKRVIKYSGLFAVHFVINNAFESRNQDTHIINIDEEIFHNMVDDMFETVWDLKTRYGWQFYNKKRGLPAYSWLGRKVVK